MGSLLTAITVFAPVAGLLNLASKGPARYRSNDSLVGLMFGEPNRAIGNAFGRK